MNYTNLKISEKCIKCGSCLGCGYEFLTSAEDGSITIKTGSIVDEHSVEFKTLTEICPVGAFEIDASVSGKDRKQLIDSMINKLKNHKGIPTPTLREFAFKKEEYSISIPSASGEYRYEYSSDSAAESAALREFERAMYSRIDTIVLKIVTEYRIKHVKPYYTAELNEGSVYAKNNKTIEEILQVVVLLSDGRLSDDFAKVNIMPNKELDWKMLNKGEIVADECIATVRSEFDYKSDDYSFKWDTDDREVPSGTDWRGNMKWKYKYCYKGLHNAFEELAKDILNACGYAHERMESQAISSASWLVDKYNKELEILLNNKIEQIKKII